eukprot:TRINITY_DN97387_c0_g1_i1.p3 TRINITY_DN97387_c0_g1~~TRINITY_DN97387_c0_g1_i1.p3  ORF type:complete len:106 (+),score=15.27 TRINITY_DN97387_c0_g1_i1:1-318(+)
MDQGCDGVARIEDDEQGKKLISLQGYVTVVTTKGVGCVSLQNRGSGLLFLEYEGLSYMQEGGRFIMSSQSQNGNVREIELELDDPEICVLCSILNKCVSRRENVS